jgi:hypothetical protein
MMDTPRDKVTRTQPERRKIGTKIRRSSRRPRGKPPKNPDALSALDTARPAITTTLPIRQLPGVSTFHSLMNGAMRRPTVTCMGHFMLRRGVAVPTPACNSLIYIEPQPQYIYFCFAVDGISIAIPSAFQGGVRR